MLTRAAAEARLVSRCRGYLALAEMSARADGQNADLDDPLLESLAQLGLPTADPTTVADADLAILAAGRTREFLARAELRLLRSVRQRTTLVSQQVGFQSRNQWGEFLISLDKAIADLADRIDREWGTVPGGAATTAVTLAPADQRSIAGNLLRRPTPP